ncbi:MAG: GDP-mannose 4,6-dehydratase [Anaerolineae bacterium]
MPHLLVTGGAGFIGSHTVRRYLDKGWQVTVYDNMSRPGAEHSLDWLRSHPASDRLSIIEGDVREYDRLAPYAAAADAILHAAGQTAVTTSVRSPRADFEANALGTFNVLEAARAALAAGRTPAVIYTSTNKVYGGMEDVGVVLKDDHYAYADLPDGAPETQPLDFHSPYGCSKGTGDQYVRDYARIYGMDTVVFRQSCIYGTWQFGTEDQGWLAHFTIAAVLDLPLTIYGDGKQVRDVLYIDDLVNAFEAVFANPARVSGQIFNIGGGPTRAISLLDLIAMLEKLRGAPMRVSYSDWRPGDQRVFISDTRKAGRALGWQPSVPVSEGVRRLYQWATEHRDLLVSIRAKLAGG